MNADPREDAPALAPVLRDSARDVLFWGEDPNVLLNREYAGEFFPVDSMSYNQKLNAVTRVVVAMTLISFAMTRNARLLAVAAFTLVSIFGLHWFRPEPPSPREGFGLSRMYKDKKVLFQQPSAENPFSNVLPADYDAAERKLSAAPASDPEIADLVLAKSKAVVSALNSKQPDIAEALFQNLGDKLSFEQSMRPFYSTPSTTIPNDQKAFLDFCYSDMQSCKTGNAFACARAAVNPKLI